MQFPSTILITNLSNEINFVKPLTQLGISKLLLFYSRSASKNNTYSKILGIIKKVKLPIIYECSLPKQPNQDFLNKLTTNNINFFQGQRIGVLSIGGGSTIDSAKAIIYFAKEYFSSNTKTKNFFIPPLIAVPTTAGTGSEVTRFAVIREKDGGQRVLQTPYLIPKIAIINGSFQETVPPDIKAYAALDALSHSIETFLSPKANFISCSISMSAASLIIHFIQEHCSFYDISVAQQMAEAATLAGIANQLVGCSIIHAMAYAISEQLEIRHGLAIAVCLPVVLQHIERKSPPSYQHFVTHFSSIKNFPEFIIKTINILPIDTTFFQRLKHLDLDSAVKRTISIKRLSTNVPIKCDTSEVYIMYEEIIKLWTK